jgi:hypothetical protein
MKKKALRTVTILSLVAIAAGGGYWLSREMESIKRTLENHYFSENSLQKKSPQTPSPHTPELPSYAQGIHSAFGKFQSGDYAAAVFLLREYVNKNPTDELAKKNLATACFALAQQRIQEQKLPEAANLLEEAAKLGHSQAASALAKLRARTGEVALAVATLEDIFWKNKDVNAAWALVDLALSRDDLPLAEAYLNRAEDLLEKTQNGDETLFRILKEKRSRYAIRAAFSKNEILLEQGNIQIAYMNPEKQRTAQAALSAMVAATEEFSHKYAPLNENTFIRAVIVPSAEFRDSTNAPPWAQAVYDGIIRLQVPDGPSTAQEMTRIASTAKHELLHAHLYILCGEIVPSWLSEGLAQFNDGRPLSQSVAALRIKHGHKLSTTLPSDAWLDKDYYEAPPELIGELYARSHLLVEALQRTQGLSVWSRVFTKSCLNKEPFSTVLHNELGHASAVELWKSQFPELSAIFQSKK